MELPPITTRDRLDTMLNDSDLEDLYIDVAVITLTNTQHGERVSRKETSILGAIQDESVVEECKEAFCRNREMMKSTQPLMACLRIFALSRFGEEAVLEMERVARKDAEDNERDFILKQPPRTAPSPSVNSDNIIGQPSKNELTPGSYSTPPVPRKKKKKRESKKKPGRSVKPKALLSREDLLSKINASIVDVSSRLPPDNQTGIVVSHFRLAELAISQVERAFDPQLHKLGTIPIIAKNFLIALQPLSKYKQIVKSQKIADVNAFGDSIVDFATNSSYAALCCSFDKKMIELDQKAEAGAQLDVPRMMAELNTAVKECGIKKMETIFELEHAVSNLSMNLLATDMMCVVLAEISIEVLYATYSKTVSQSFKGIMERAQKLWANVLQDAPFDKKTSALDFIIKVLMPALASPVLESEAVDVAHDIESKLRDGHQKRRGKNLNEVFSVADSRTLDGSSSDSGIVWVGSPGPEPAKKNRDQYRKWHTKYETIKARRKRMLCIFFNLLLWNQVQKKLPDETLESTARGKDGAGFKPEKFKLTCQAFLLNSSSYIKRSCNFFNQDLNFFENLNVAHDMKSENVRSICEGFKKFAVGGKPLIIGQDQIAAMRKLCEPEKYLEA